MDILNTLQSLGVTIPGPTYLIGAVLFSIVGYVGYRHGKKAKLATPRWIGIALMLYPYAVSDTWLLYAVGGVLCVGLYVFRK